MYMYLFFYRLLNVLTIFTDNLQFEASRDMSNFVQTSYTLFVENIEVTGFDGETFSTSLGRLGLTNDAPNRDIEKGSKTKPSEVHKGTEFGVQNVTRQITAVVKIPKTIFKDIGLSGSKYRLSYSVFTQTGLFQSSDESQANLTLGSVIVSVRVRGVNESVAVTLTEDIEVIFQVSLYGDFVHEFN